MMPERPVGDHLDQALRSAVGLLADAAPPVGDLEELLALEPSRQPGSRQRSRKLLLVGSAVALLLVLGAVWQAVSNGDSRTIADESLDGCEHPTASAWCIEGPRGVALVGELVWTVDRFGSLIAVDRAEGLRMYRSAEPVGGEAARVISRAGEHVLLGDGSELIVVDHDGVVVATYVPRPEWTVVDGAGATIDDLYVIIVRGDKRELVGIRNGSVRDLSQDVDPESIELLSDGRIVVVDATTRELLVMATDGAIVDRLFTRMPEGSVSAHRSSLAVLAATGDPSVVLWLSVDDGTVRLWSLEGFDPGQPISIDPSGRLLATVDESLGTILVAPVPPR